MSVVYDFIPEITTGQKFHIEVGQTLRVYSYMDACSCVCICSLHARDSVDISRPMAVWCYMKNKAYEGNINRRLDRLLRIRCCKTHEIP